MFRILFLVLETGTRPPNPFDFSAKTEPFDWRIEAKNRNDVFTCFAAANHEPRGFELRPFVVQWFCTKSVAFRNKQDQKIAIVQIEWSKHFQS